LQINYILSFEEITLKFISISEQVEDVLQLSPLLHALYHVGCQTILTALSHEVYFVLISSFAFVFYSFVLGDLLRDLEFEVGTIVFILPFTFMGFMPH
jgi:hypothetical protein